MSVAVDRKSDQNRAVAGRERHRLGEGLVEAGSYKRKGCGGDRSAQKQTSIDRLWLIAAFGRHGRLHCLKTVLEPARAHPGAHIAQGRSSKCGLILRRSQIVAARSSRAREPPPGERNGGLGLRLAMTSSSSGITGRSGRRPNLASTHSSPILISAHRRDLTLLAKLTVGRQIRATQVLEAAATCIQVFDLRP